jgi:uridine kinase
MTDIIFRKIIEKIQPSNLIKIISVTGNVCSGKTYFSRELVEYLQSIGKYPILWHSDMYFRSTRYEREKVRKLIEENGWRKEYETILEIDKELQAKHLASLKRGENVLFPNAYNHNTGLTDLLAKADFTGVNIPDAYVIHEGTQTIHPEIRPLLNLVVFLFVDYEIRKKRFCERTQRDLNVEEAEERFNFRNALREPYFNAYLLPSDVRINNNDFRNRKIMN